MATLTGKIIDVTSRPPDSISSITVKAPSARIGSGTDVIVSSPAGVTFDKTTGDITISGLTGGLSWLYIEGDGWSDSIALSVAEGMIALVEAVANAVGIPGLADYIRLLAELETRIDGIAQDAVDRAAESIRWFKGFIDDTHTTMADVPVGLWGISAQTHAVRLGLPADFGTLQVMTMGSSRAAFFIGRTIGLYINMSQGDVWGEWHQPWAKDKWFNGAITDAHQTMNDVSVGVWNIPARTHAVRLGLPMDYGSLQVMQIGLSKTAFFIGQSTGFWINSSNGDVWGEWQRPTGSGGSGGGGGAAGLKTVGMALTAGSLLDGVAGRYRVLTQVTAPVVRWRLHVESHRMLSNTTSAFTLGDVYIGSHSGNGAMTGQQQIKSGNLSVPADGEWASPWLDASLLANETLIDLNLTGSELYWSQATSWVYENGSWVSSKNSPASIWVELETFDQVPVVGMIGDSTGGGQGADRPVFDSALYIAARKDKFIPMAYTYPGSSMQSINDYGFHLFQRWAHLDKPDSVIIQSGSNDIHTGASTAELQTRFADLVETAEMISPVVIGATVKARYPDSGEHQTTLNAHNAFVKTRANGNRDYLDFYQAVSPTGTVAAADAADAAHLSTSGHQKLATAFDTVTVSRPAVIDTQDAKPGQVLKWDGTGFKWAWLGQYPSNYHDTY